MERKIRPFGKNCIESTLLRIIRNIHQSSGLKYRRIFFGHHGIMTSDDT